MMSVFVVSISYSKYLLLTNVYNANYYNAYSSTVLLKASYLNLFIVLCHLGKPWVVVMDVTSMDCMKLCEECERVKKMGPGADGWIVASSNISKFRGLWFPQFVIVQQGAEKSALMKWTDSG